MYEAVLGERDLVDRVTAGYERPGRTQVDRDGDPAMSHISEAQPPSDQRDRMMAIEIEVARRRSVGAVDAPCRNQRLPDVWEER